MDLSGARIAGELHALADSLNEEIDKLDSGDLDVQGQRMATTLEDEISKLAHKRFSSVTEKPHQNLRYGPEGRIPIIPAGPGSSRPKRKKMGTPKEGSGKSSALLVVIVRSYPVSYYPSAIVCCCSWHS